MMIDPAPTDQGVFNRDECHVDVVASLVTHAQPPGALLPAKRPLRHPAKTAQLLAAFHPTAREPRFNPALSQPTTQLLVVIGFVCIHLRGAMAWSAPLATHKWNDIHHGQQLLPVSDIGSRQQRCQWQAVPVYHLVTLGARSAPIHRRRPNRLAERPPFFAPLARTKRLSTLARLQSIWWAASSLASSISWSLCHTPAWCQFRSLRQQVMPLPHPISAGKSSQASPVLRTKRIPVSALRSGTGGRPRLPGWARWSGRSGSTTAQSASLTSSFAMTGLYPARHFC